MPIAMISQPMGEKSVDEIQEIRLRAEQHLNSRGYEVIHTWLYNEDDRINLVRYNGIDLPVLNEPVIMLGWAITAMSAVDLVYFCAGWENARGCRIEHDVAVEYDIAIEHEVI